MEYPAYTELDGSIQKVAGLRLDNVPLVHLSGLRPHMSSYGCPTSTSPLDYPSIPPQLCSRWR